MTIASLLQAVKELCGARLWSNAVELTRNSEIIIESRTESEYVLRILVKGRPVSPTVTLWPDEDGWVCDCDEEQDPCIHVAAAVIAANAGAIKRPEESTSFASLVYEFSRDQGSLVFKRMIDDGRTKAELRQPLVRYLGGVNSGRIKGRLVSANRADLAIDAVLEGRTAGKLDNRTLHRLFSVLAPFNNVFLDGFPVRTSREPIRLGAELVREQSGFRLRVSHGYSGERFLNGAALVAGELRAVLADELTEEDIKLLGSGGSFYAAEQLGRLACEVVPDLSRRIDLSLPGEFPKLRDIRPRVSFQVDPLGPDLFTVTPRMLYGDPPLAEVRPEGIVLFGERYAPVRKPEEERSLVQALRADFNLRLGTPVKFMGEEGAQFLRRLKQDQIFGEGVAERSIRGELKPQFSSEAEQFTLSFKLPGGGGSASATDVFSAWHEGREYLPLLDGSYASLPLDWLERFGPRIEELLHAIEVEGRLPGVLRPGAAALFEELPAVETPPFLSGLRRRLELFEELPQAELPSDLRAELRPYQREGVNWLSFIRSLECGALLADDMGLGKTLQALCVVRGRTLVVAPTSVMYGWLEQIAGFRPDLRAALYHGAGRSLDPQADITVTSYGILRMDREELAREAWDSVIVDEAQTIKNPQSRAAQAAFALQASFRLALTGTPVENRLSDVWSEFNFINPGLLGTERDFNERYGRAVRRGDPEALAELRKKVRPFILRRKKSVVAKDLPPRTETVLYCELSAEEEELYQALLSSVRAEVVAQLSAGKGIFTALEALLRLRQACCHPALLPGRQTETSAKLEVLLENLEEALSEGHKALVFSQWTRMLDLIEPQLQLRDVAFLRLDGSTRNRNDVVEAFQAAEGPPVMLMSLKAGGVGLTLTAADVVFLMDPWWNPAAEDQAADRAHRIGQLNPVLIQRLVAKGTIEERVLKLQEDKRRLAEAVLEGGEGAVGLTKEDLLELLG